MFFSPFKGFSRILLLAQLPDLAYYEVPGPMPFTYTPHEQKFFVI